MLSRDQIINARDFDKEEVEVPEWGGTVFIRSMSIKSSDEMNRFYRKLAPKTKKSSDLKNMTEDDLDLDNITLDHMSELVSRCLCNEAGDLLFNDEKGRSILNSKNPKVIEKLYEVALRVNTISENSIEQEKKESLTTATIGSNSNSV